MNLVRRQCLRILQSNVRNQSLSCRASSFKSALSLENLYPGSKLKLHTPTFVSVNTELLKNTYILNKIAIYRFYYYYLCYTLSNITSMSTERFVLGVTA